MIATIMIAAAAGVVGAFAGAILMGLVLGPRLNDAREARDIALDTLKRADRAYDVVSGELDKTLIALRKHESAEMKRQAPLRDANAKRRADAAAKVGA